ncbi:hypothetical protein HanPI659440_Chr01g0007181 [Helianthus annuus]|nr:hypothetical protein HanPI659440_Chr01g0007181 [Helianthus annuus]
MFSVLLIFAYLMADVAPWGHGGDGAGDPSPPGGHFRGTHETDGKSFTKLYCSPYILYIINVVTNYFVLIAVVPPKRVSGKAKNEFLDSVFSAVKLAGCCIYSCCIKKKDF